MSDPIKGKPEKSENDREHVIFMTAYSLDEYNNSLSDEYNKSLTLDLSSNRFKTLLSENHISSLAVNQTILTQHGEVNYTSQFHPDIHRTIYQFDVCDNDESTEKYDEELQKMSELLPLEHSTQTLLDGRFKFLFFIVLEPFLVSINSRILQVDSTAFLLEDSVFVSFELMDYHTSLPINKDEIYGFQNNYNIIPVESVKYTDGADMLPDKRLISNIVFENISEFFGKLTRYKFQINRNNKVHNLFIYANDISAIHPYFQEVLEVEKLDFLLKNLNTNQSFHYYSYRNLGVVTAITDKNRRQALFDCQLLEAFKMYFYLNQNVNPKEPNNYIKNLEKQMTINSISSQSGVPIITCNLIKYLMNTESYKQYQKDIDFEISYLKLWQGRRRNRNGFFLNILIYILAFCVSINILPALLALLGFPLEGCIIFVAILLIGLGIHLMRQEWKQ